MQLKRIGLAVGAFVAVAALVAGCSQAPESNDGTTEITYWTWFPPQSTLDAAIAAFEAENPDITVTLKTFEGADYQKQLPLALSGGQAVDVAGVQISAMTNSVKDYLDPAEDWAADFLPTINSTMVDQTKDIASDGVLYSVPMGSIGSPVMYYNADILDSLDLEVPETATEWKVAVDAISEAMPEVTPVVFLGDVYWQEEMLFAIAEQTSPGLSDDIIGGDGSWDQAGIVDGLKAYKSLFDDGIVGTDVLSLTGTRPNELFGQGLAAFYIDGSWNNSLLSASYREENDIAVADVGATTVPLVDGGQPAIRALAEGGLAIPTESEHKEEAARFIEFMVSSAGADVWAKDLILVPSLTGYELSDSVLESDAAVAGFAAATAAISAPTSNRDSQQDFLNTVEGNAILDVLRGTTTAEEAAATMQSEWTSGRYPHGSDQ
ncbi:ABC transporter substrate-binding protein [Salinibacterium sp. NK8237]|uniref:ABC transporter substrate-binding protein n=1 Tax=Salinibacterium sp. NK8237 TaxID=2792038 RepID=UPI0018CD03A9|nr:extracellular solute-binding protein [Salinibacterium sp. NK8237]MBH0130631.1 extracellular solute-binding protein [Salinibacterium sp. NK8237]